MNVEINGRHGVKFSKKNIPSSMEKLHLMFMENGTRYQEPEVRSWAHGFPMSHHANIISYSQLGNYGKLSPPFPMPSRVPVRSPAALNHVSMPVEHVAINFFMSEFVLTSNNTTPGYLDYLIPLLNNSGTNSTFNVTCSAVAMVAFGSRPNSKTVYPMAEGLYAKALKAINTSLRHPTEAMDDATLASVMLLSTWEVTFHRSSHCQYISDSFV